MSAALRELAVPDAHLVVPVQHGDERGTFLEWLRADDLAELGHPFEVAQANASVSRPGALRGIHYADVPPGQAKYVTCVRGAVLDVVVDLRVGSPAFGSWDAVRLDDRDRAALFVAEGLGHAFCALEPDTTVVYLCSDVYRPAAEHGVHPLDPALGIDWAGHLPAGTTPVLSAKDAAAPTLAQALAAGALPSYEDCRRRYAGARPVETAQR
ncbi:MAG TPA: dTDP-4-dehydrorhamnose 3,5-epimerase [Kineosporiaceae bacterium]|nr:dTDP-4-dehydrorhamnose 3,5-epimerase [Kineosporiaceae bacterium]